ncbi:5-methyltetrahydrofolate--homocysteine methyltransferase [Aliiglaciecola sp. SL4]|uniref:5-methyltetrahydrofolate--homocysteine methyltransferase n=1 Tax=Aliiglaciecola sp. SL4 TaxID=3239806 RepID=UPI00355B82C9
MISTRKLSFLAASIGALMLTGCGDAETTILEKESIEVDDSIEDDHDHSDDQYLIESMGRLAVLTADSSAAIYDLDDGDELDTFSLTYASSTLTSSADYRYAVIASRSDDYVGFIDSGMWREDHGEHLHDYEQAPAMSDYEITGSLPTHIIKHDGQMAIFFDGDAESNTPASVKVATDTDISGENSDLPTLNYSVNMHGAVEPKGEYLLSTFRRDDAESTSVAKVLPDQVALYHLHDGEYEQELVLDVLCPDLHGSAINESHAVFGCGDGVLTAHEHEGDYEAEKITNIDVLDGLRIGTIYGHEENDTFIGIAAGHNGGESILIKIAPEDSEMEALEWQPESDASPVAYGFSYEGDMFLVLDSQGYLNILSAHDHDGETHWELEQSFDITDEDVANMPEGMSFSMAVAQNGNYVYVSDPIAEHVLQIDLETIEVVSDIELGFAAASISWLGIAEEAHDH